MIRLLFLAHRYLGIAVGWLMAVWCLSGLVMMYQSYPAPGARTRLAHLAPIDWRDCCRVSPAIIGDHAAMPRFRIEMLAGRPVLDWERGPRASGLIDLSTGRPIGAVSATEATRVAAAYAIGAPRLLGKIDFDQWTLEGIPQRDRPLYHFGLADGRGGQLYVSSSTGRVVQLTTRAERFWGWLGAVPHWLYFADLRQHVGLWSPIVIYTSLIGCFLTVTGLYIGVRQLIRRPPRGWSPYRGFKLWHHWVGLFFGVLTLTWVLSGMLSLNPWGLMEGAGAGPARVRLRGTPITGAQLRTALQALAAAAPAGVVSIESAPLDGRLFTIATAADGSRRRLDAAGMRAPLSSAERRLIATALGGGGRQMAWLEAGDDYYFSRAGDTVELPVWRVLPRDGTGRRFYVDPVSGALVDAMDAGSEHYRWWFGALHRMDFAAAIRGRPQWDLLMWLLMTGVTIVCVTGTYLGCRRLGKRS